LFAACPPQDIRGGMGSCRRGLGSWPLNMDSITKNSRIASHNPLPNSLLIRLFVTSNWAFLTWPTTPYCWTSGSEVQTRLNRLCPLRVLSVRATGDPHIDLQQRTKCLLRFWTRDTCHGHAREEDEDWLCSYHFLFWSLVMFL
jgi:hypothetical protein